MNKDKTEISDKTSDNNGDNVELLQKQLKELEDKQYKLFKIILGYHHLDIADIIPLIVNSDKKAFFDKEYTGFKHYITSINNCLSLQNKINQLNYDIIEFF